MKHKMAVLIKGMSGMLRQFGYDEFFNVELKDGIYYVETKSEYNYQLFIIGRCTEVENFFKFRADLVKYVITLEKGR